MDESEDRFVTKGTSLVCTGAEELAFFRIGFLVSFFPWFQRRESEKSLDALEKYCDDEEEDPCKVGSSLSLKDIVFEPN